jgi:hypothetical protein
MINLEIRPYNPKWVVEFDKIASSCPDTVSAADIRAGIPANTCGGG